MSVSTELSRITEARNTIRNKMVELSLVESTATIDVLATAVSGIENRGAVSVEVKEGETYTIPKGYHNGSGTVAGVKGGGNYSLQAKTVTPTKAEQDITSDEGYYGLSGVTVAPIPEAYQDVTAVTAGEGDVLAGKVIVDSTGAVKTGTMANNGAVEKTLDVNATSYNVPAGYHNGSGAVSIVLEEKSVIPAESAQEIVPTTGKVLSKVLVAAIPEKYINCENATVEAGDILLGEKAYGYDAETGEAIEIVGTMPNNGSVSDDLNCGEEFVIPAGYHDGTGKVTANSLASQTGATAEAGQILEGETAWVNGEKVEGSMPNNGAVDQTLDVSKPSYTVPAGYHDGEGVIDISLEEKAVTPTKAEQVIAPTAGKVLSEVTVAPIPAEYQVVTGVTAGAADVLAGKVIVDATGKEVTGTMANNGALNGEIDGLATLSYTIPAGYTSGGTVSFTNDIEEALKAI